MDISNKPIIIIGPMGSGKTSVGRKLASLLKRDFYDTDAEIIKRTRVSISHIFDVEGEAGFRLREKRILSTLCQIDDIVLATGGGVVIDRDNRRMIKTHGFVVYLYCTIDCLVERVEKADHRPLLSVGRKRQQMIDIFSQREQYYEDLADLRIDTKNKKFNMIVKEIKQTFLQCA